MPSPEQHHAEPRTEENPAIKIATLVLEICDTLDSHTKEKGPFSPETAQTTSELHSVLRASRGSPILPEKLIQKLQEYGTYRPYNGFPDAIGIDLRTVNNKKRNKTGVFTPVEAEEYELRQLIITEPNAIAAFLRNGHIGEAERTTQAYQEWVQSFEDFHQGQYDTSEHLSLFYKLPEAQKHWRNKVKLNL